MNHYVFDCVVDKGNEFLSSECFLFYALKRMAKMHDLFAVSEPFVRPYYEECSPIDSGISAIMFLQNGGHITIHTFPKRHCYYMDVLTDKDEFDKAEAYVKRFLPYIEKYSNIRVLSVKDVDEKYDKSKHFGPHLIYELKNVRMDMSTMFKRLKSLPELIDMTPISQPIVVEDKDYIDGAVIIAESHISIHYYKGKNKAYIDVFSCMPFDYDVVDKYVSLLGDISMKKIYARANKNELAYKSDKGEN